jgi:hypothetical protein
MLTVFAIFWVLIWVLTLFDLFRRDWSTGVKLLWALGMLILPVVGVLAYLIVRPPSSADTHGVVGSAVGSADQSAERARDRRPA